MLQNIRNNVQGPTTKIVVWLIVISFSIFGLESILVSGGSGGVAEVNGEQVTPQEMQMAVNTQKRRLISMMGENIDPSMLDETTAVVESYPHCPSPRKGLKPNLTPAHRHKLRNR